MKKILHKTILLLTLLICTLHLSAQEVRTTLANDNTILTMQVDVDKQKLIKEDALLATQGFPLRTSLLFPIQASIQTVGKWEILNDGSSSWIFTIKVPESEGVMLFYKDFYIPPGGELFIYSETGKMETSIYRHSNNGQGGFFSTETQIGSEVTLEYIADKTVTEKPRIAITDVGFKYNSIYQALPTVSGTGMNIRNSANRCIPNINCLEFRNWSEQKKGVVKITMNTGFSTYSCTGTLVNNTAKDKKPYVLTAYHCFHKLDPQGNDAIIEKTAFVFDYEYPACENEIMLPSGKRVTGALLLTENPIHGGADGTLLEITGVLDPTWDVYYNGWSTYNPISWQTSGAIIQHPHGDTKKIASYNSSLRSVQWNGSDGSLGARSAHWQVQYNRGVSQPGSSGSPLFNEEGLIIGTLSGGSSSCSAPNESDYFGKFAYHWNLSTDETRHMKKYLDPLNSGAIKLEGMNKDGNIKPPPTQDVENIELSWNGSNITVLAQKPIQKVRVVSQAGHQIYENGVVTKATFNRHDIPTVNWLSGLYIITIWLEDGGKHTQKIMK